MNKSLFSFQALLQYSINVCYDLNNRIGDDVEMKYIFDTWQNRPMKIINDCAYDEIIEDIFPITPDHERCHVEITQSSYEVIKMNLKNLRKAEAEFADEIADGLVTNINKELIKYGL